MLLLFPLLTVLRYVDETGQRWPLRPLAISLVLLWFPPLWADALRAQPWLYGALHTGWGALLVPPLYGLACIVCGARNAPVQCGRCNNAMWAMRCPRCPPPYTM